MNKLLILVLLTACTPRYEKIYYQVYITNEVDTKYFEDPYIELSFILEQGEISKFKGEEFDWGYTKPIMNNAIPNRKRYLTLGKKNEVVKIENELDLLNHFAKGGYEVISTVKDGIYTTYRFKKKD